MFFMPEVELNGSRVLAGVGQIKAVACRSMWWVDRECDARSFGSLGVDLVGRAPRHRATALRREHVHRGITLFAFPCPQGPSALGRAMGGRGRATLYSSNVQQAGFEMDLILALKRK